MSGPALEGDLQHFYPTEVLQLMHLAQAHGRLELERVKETVEIFFERGRPIFARTSAATVRSGEVLVHRGAITRQELVEALAGQANQPGQRLGERLVASGRVTPEQVQDSVREVLRRIVYGVLLWRDGRFRFHPGERPGEEDIQLDLDLDRLILEGLKLADHQRASGA